MEYGFPKKLRKYDTIQLCNHRAIISRSPLEVYLLLCGEKNTSVFQDVFTYAIWGHVSLKSLESDQFRDSFYSKKIQLFFVLLQHMVIYIQFHSNAPCSIGFNIWWFNFLVILTLFEIIVRCNICSWMRHLTSVWLIYSIVWWCCNFSQEEDFLCLLPWSLYCIVENSVMKTRKKIFFQKYIIKIVLFC